jgi:hypothetical protein
LLRQREEAREGEKEAVWWDAGEDGEGEAGETLGWRDMWEGVFGHSGGAETEEGPDTLLSLPSAPTMDERVRAFKKSLKKITPWRMNDLTIGQYVKLARKLVAEKKMWKQFSNLM